MQGILETAASVDKTGCQTEYRKLKHINNQTNQALKTVNKVPFVTRKNMMQEVWQNEILTVKLTVNTIWFK